MYKLKQSNNKELKELKNRLSEAISALQIILTWATFEYKNCPKGHALDSNHVADLCQKTLKNIKDS